MALKHKVGIIGSTGYTGLALAGLLINHPNVEISFLGSEQYAGQKFSKVYPGLTGLIDMKCQKAEMKNLEKLDLVFFATPNGIAHKTAPSLIKKGIHVVDLSADYRFRDLKTYEKWYGFKRSNKADKEINKKAVYGLVEFMRDEILKLAESKQAALIGNPGCYTTATILALSPLLKNKQMLDLNSIIVDAKSGVSGAGRKLATGSLYTEVNDSIAPYNLANKHRHTPELEMFFNHISSSKGIELSFSPHLSPMTNGILATCYVTLKESYVKKHKVNENFIRKIYAEAYKDESFVELLDKDIYPRSRWVLGSNRCLIQVSYDARLRRAIITSVIDNVIKGAAGQAVQNMNLLLGLEEGAGLKLSPQLP